MCRQLEVPRASYYRWRKAEETPTALRRRELTGLVKTMFDSSEGIFGHRKVHAKLTAAVTDVSWARWPNDMRFRAVLQPVVEFVRELGPVVSEPRRHVQGPSDATGIEDLCEVWDLQPWSESTYFRSPFHSLPSP